MTTTAIPRTASVWEDFIDIFVSPAQVFARRKGRGFWVPLIVFTVIMAALIIGTKPLMQPVFDALWPQTSAQILAKRPEVTAEQLASIRRSQPVIYMVVATVLAPLSAMAVGLLLWLVGKLFDSEQSVGDAIMVSTYSFFPKILGGVAAALIALLVDPASITSQWSVTASLGRFVDGATHPVLAALLARVDVFTIWVTVLLAVGLYVTGKVPKGKAAIAAIIVWIIGALPPLYQAMQVTK